MQERNASQVQSNRRETAAYDIQCRELHKVRDCHTHFSAGEEERID